MKKNDSLIQQTIYRSGDDEVMTVHGLMRWSTWLRKEWTRIRGTKGRQAAIRKNDRGEIALYVNDISGSGNTKVDATLVNVRTMEG